MSGSKCGTCRFAKQLPAEVKDLQQRITQRICWGAPPHVVEYTAPAQGGLMLVQKVMRPSVGVGDDACALYQQESDQ